MKLNLIKEKIQKQVIRLMEQKYNLNWNNFEYSIKDGLVTQLKLRGQNFKSIKEIEGLEKLTSLECLDLAGNQIEEIEGLEHFPNLRVLSFSDFDHGLGNQITEIKGLENLTNLKWLILAGNQITEIKGLETLSNLGSLYLNFNQIREISGLGKLINLTILNLSHNRISLINGQAFKNLNKLSQLILESNPITEIKNIDQYSEVPIINRFNFQRKRKFLKK